MAGMRVVAAWLLLSSTACDAGGPASEPALGTDRQASTAVPESSAPTSPLLAIETRVARAGGFFVTPRWSPDGDRLLLSGYRGIGLYLAAPDDGSVRELDPLHSGPAWWTTDGRSVVHARPRAGAAYCEIDLVSGVRRDVPQPDFLPRPHVLRDGAAEAGILVDGPAGPIVYEEYRGRIVVLADGEERVLSEEDAWDPRPSPDGRRIAWCIGHLVAPELRIADAADGRLLFVGPGAHPAWLPDGEHLVFTEPIGGEGSAGAPAVVGAELTLVDLRSGARTALTATADAIEMQPAVAPGGGRLAWADWSTGAVLIGRLVVQGAPETGGAP